MMSRRMHLYKRQRGRCYYCDCPCRMDGGEGPYLFTVDHKLPKALGGRRTKENTVGACKYCNSLKGQMTAGEFIKWMAGKDMDEMKGRPSHVNRKALRQERRRQIREATAHLPTTRKRSMPSCPPDLASLFSVSMAEIFPLPTPGGT